jgi:Flp pilus assembly protein TadG/uncharacterized protein YegL
MSCFSQQFFYASRRLSDKSGNFGILSALIAPVLFAGASLTIDIVGMMQTKAEMAGAVDAASLAASSAMASKGISEDEAKKIAMRYLKGYSQDKRDFASMATFEVSVTGEGSSKSYAVNVKTSYDYSTSTFTSLLTGGTKMINVEGTSVSTATKTETTTPTSIYLVLDQSSSMLWPSSDPIGTYSEDTLIYCDTGANYMEKCPRAKGSTKYREKIDVLKIAVNRLTTRLDKVDPTSDYVRTGAVAFAWDALTPSPLEWGTKQTSTYVNGLGTRGGTNSSGALKIGYKSLSDHSEKTAHKKKNSGDVAKTIIYMTDGVNNESWMNDESQAWCYAAKHAGYEVYSVGFMVPEEATPFLLSCATDAEHFYNASDAEALYAAFDKIGLKQSTQLVSRISK